jgi:transposase
MVVCTPIISQSIILLKEAGHGSRAIATRLGIGKSTVNDELKRLASVNNNIHKKRLYKGRARLFDDRDIRRAKRWILGGRAFDATDLQRKLFPDHSPRRVREMLSRVGLKGRVRRKRPLLTKRHVQLRRKWAADHVDWVPNDWASVIWSDKSKINLVASDGRTWCRRYPGQAYLSRNVTKTVKHGGGSVMVWGCITPSGVGRILRIRGKMKATDYIKILEKGYLGTLKDRKIPKDHIIFQQDNDPKHTANITKAWLLDQDIDKLDWAPQSPDMNIIEHVWRILKLRIAHNWGRFSSVEALWVAVKLEWAKITPEEIQDLYASVPRRVQALSDAKGSYTKY